MNKKKKIKVLVVSYFPWRSDSNVGNSLSSIFSGFDEELEIAHIYIKDGFPDNNIVHKYFHISEKKLIKSIITRKPVGKSEYYENPIHKNNITFSKTYNIARLLRWEMFLVARDILSDCGCWKTKALHDFVEEFKPDLIFANLDRIPIINKMLLHLKKEFNIPVALYPWDDMFIGNGIHISPNILVRKYYNDFYMRKCIAEADLMYCITDMMCKEYSEKFNCDCKLLTKGYNFDKNKKYIKNEINECIEISFTGNIGGNRWKMIAKFAESIAIVNSEKPKSFFLSIYTLIPVSEKMSKALNILGTSQVKKPLTGDEVVKVLESSDILLQAESNDKKNLKLSRLSFSTKIVDYMFAKKCILAIGGNNAAMKFLKDNDAALVEENSDNYCNLLRKILEQPDLIEIYAEKAWNCGKRNHNIKTIQNNLLEDFNLVINQERW